MCYAFETFSRRLAAATALTASPAKRMTIDRYTISELSFSSLRVLMNLMWYVAILAPATGSDITLNADGPTQIGGICRLKGS